MHLVEAQVWVEGVLVALVRHAEQQLVAALHPDLQQRSSSKIVLQWCLANRCDFVLVDILPDSSDHQVFPPAAAPR